MRRDADLRVCDADREAVADVLKRHYLVGRLTDDELAARVDAAYAARYESELIALLRDLPSLSRRAPAPQPRQGRSPLVAAGTVTIAAAVLLMVAPDLSAVLLGVAVVLLVLTVVLAVIMAPVALPVAVVAWLVHALSRPRPRRQLTFSPPPARHRPPRRF